MAWESDLEQKKRNGSFEDGILWVDSETIYDEIAKYEHFVLLITDNAE